MSYLYAQDPNEQAKAYDLAATHSTTDLPKPGFFSGVVEAPLAGLWSGIVAKPALLIGDVATAPLAGAARSFGADSVATWLEAEQKKNVEMVKSLKERGASYGTAGQVLNGVTDVLPQAIAGAAVGGVAGAAAAPAALQGYADARMGIEEGLDPTTAAQRGAITAVATGVGALVPMAVGGSVLKSVALGVGTNVPLGMAQRGATSALLEANGYADMAKQYQWLDKEALLVDATLGAAFGVLGARMNRRKMTVDETDAALVGNERQHIEIEAQPGIHTTPESRNAGVRGFEKAVEDMLVRGEDPDVSAIAPKLEVVQNPEAVAFHKDATKELAPYTPKYEPPVESVRQAAAEPVTPPAEFAAKLEQRIAALEAEAQPKATAEGQAAQVAPEVQRQLEREQALRTVAEPVAKLYSGDSVIIDRPGKPAEALTVERKGDTLVLKNRDGEVVETVMENGRGGNDVVRFAEKMKSGEYKVLPDPKPGVMDATDAVVAKAGNVDAVSADMARQIIDTYPDLTIPTEAGERRLVDVLAEADAEIMQAKNEGILHDVAVACFLRG